MEGRRGTLGTNALSSGDSDSALMSTRPHREYQLHAPVSVYLVLSVLLSSPAAIPILFVCHQLALFELLWIFTRLPQSTSALPISIRTAS